MQILDAVKGEFVDELCIRGFNAIGFDSVLRRLDSHLHACYWDPQRDGGADLFVMRCVLPHVPDPWRFLAALAESSPGSLVLIEFQSLEWILAQSIWYQISHDHVNLISIKDFFDRYTVIDSGEFRDSEWAWMLIDPCSFRPPPAKGCDRREQIH